MARKKQGGGGESGGNWMDTYGDLVTLLLTFFILMYATSSPDEVKWQMILQAFTSRGSVVNPIVDQENQTHSDEPYTSDELSDGDMPETFDQLYQYLEGYLAESEFSDSIELSQSASNIYLKFRDNVFFAGDSAVLLDTGKEVLDVINTGLAAVSDKIMAIQVGGHTAVANFSTQDDYTLSSDRAVNVVNYVKAANIIEPGKLRTEGYGEYRPVAPNDTEENKALNRRVEMVIVRNDVDFTDPEIINDFLVHEFGDFYTPPEGYTPEEDGDLSLDDIEELLTQDGSVETDAEGNIIEDEVDEESEVEETEASEIEETAVSE